MPRRIEILRKKRSLPTLPRKIEEQPGNVKSLAPAGANIQLCLKTDLGLT